MNRQRWLWIFAVVVLHVASRLQGQVLEAATGPRYSVTSLGTLRNTRQPEGFAINDIGYIVGSFTRNRGGYGAFVWNPGSCMRDLGWLKKFPNMQALAINHTNQVAGSAANTDINPIYHAVLWDPTGGGIRDLGTIDDYTLSVGSGITIGTQVVGSLWGSKTRLGHAFIWNLGMIDLGTPCPDDLYASSGATGTNIGGTYVVGVAGPFPSADGTCVYQEETYPAFWSTGTGKWTQLISPQNATGFVIPAAVNSAGIIVGSALESDDLLHAILWENTIPIDLGSLGYAKPQSKALALNDVGQVVGFSLTENGDTHAFVWDAKDGMQDLNLLVPTTPGLILNSATAINDKGQIVANGWDRVHGYGAFLLDPSGHQYRHCR